MFVFDTDHIGILQRGRGPAFDKLTEKLRKANEVDIYVTIISFHEQVAGWTKHVKGSLEQSKIVFGYLRLESILQDFSESQVLPYSPAASEIFEDLRNQKIRIPTMDLRIASIVIANQMVLVTRNQRDFEKVPNLEMEDWTS